MITGRGPVLPALHSISSLFRFDYAKSQRRKKLRGAWRRALRAVKDARAFEREFPEDGWSNYWHQHLDWKGIGNRGPELRCVFLRAHAKLFRYLALQAGALSKPYQLWITLQIHDAGQDAVFFHTANPQSVFPANCGELRWGLPELASVFSEWLPEFSLFAGRNMGAIFIYAEGIGVPLRQARADHEIATSPGQEPMQPGIPPEHSLSKGWAAHPFFF